ncbi:alkanesulfonate monooxygenase SsuD/methylene tetrahydromethanopterin reductase-like flavin-dependent oxidoreductase (luciferase family) [Conyzicola lurida]|uniref:Alkanesulfonate monooxygenase SsuD/methylene tetrahydromethanopterin reductase-like flavin-dependent oxidoreductase (Luciferase family) n=1 Tax=Conyzicola lurida TaxID=1172621 RepID=A0A841ARU1_9MICO|nr:LLM class flavin-dependent oxidoreductase [Conyzicola lurida]MBB5844662.1 alkanesulfonate monooxygenase SsuD/methylene tetrahydromethanopterin reductase-like flavin-dependent oxidoreductase (luciferase family) [Conyzicola lurida]
MARNIGVVLPRSIHPTQIASFARTAESSGFSEVWVVEEPFHRGVVAQACVILSVTSTLTVGVRLLACPARNPVSTSLELAALARIFPHRLLAAVTADAGSLYYEPGLSAEESGAAGVAAEHARTIRHLLNGGEIDVSVSSGVNFSVALDECVEEPPLVFHDSSVEVDGDGVVLPYLSSPSFAALATVFAPTRVAVAQVTAHAECREEAVAEARATLAVLEEPDWDAALVGLDFADELRFARLAARSYRSFVADMPDAWIEALALVGSAEQIQGRIDEFRRAGVTVVVMILAGEDEIDAVARLGALVHQPAGIAAVGADR